LASAHPTTCCWFLAKNEFIAWNDVEHLPDHSGFLWIQGNPGTGKSTLIKFLFEEAKLKARGNRLRMVLSFFFLARGAAEKKSTIGLYISLLHQLFQNRLELSDSLDWMTADGAKIIERNGWHEEALKRTLTEAA
jgi:hypothetical protein